MNRGVYFPQMLCEGNLAKMYNFFALLQRWIYKYILDVSCGGAEGGTFDKKI